MYELLTYETGFIFYILLFVFISIIVKKLYIRDLSSQIILIGELFACVNSVLLTFISSAEFINIITVNHNLRIGICKIFMTYFIFDFFVISYDYYLKPNSMYFIYIIHHILCILILLLGIYTTQDNITIFSIIGIIEFTNIFKNIYILYTIFYSYTDNTSFILLLLWTIFFIFCRVIILPFFIGKIYYYDIPENTITLSGGLIGIILLIITQILMIMWGYKLVKKIYRQI